MSGFAPDDWVEALLLAFALLFAASGLYVAAILDTNTMSDTEVVISAMGLTMYLVPLMSYRMLLCRPYQRVES